MDYSNLDLEKINSKTTTNTAIYIIPLLCKLGKMPSNIDISFKKYYLKFLD